MSSLHNIFLTKKTDDTIYLIKLTVFYSLLTMLIYSLCVCCIAIDIGSRIGYFVRMPNMRVRALALLANGILKKYILFLTQVVIDQKHKLFEGSLSLSRSCRYHGNNESMYIS